jgi:hypothetical protein
MRPLMGRQLARQHRIEIALQPPFETWYSGGFARPHDALFVDDNGGAD